MAISVNFASVYPLTIGGYGLPGYSALYTLVLNLGIAAACTPLFRACRGGVRPADTTVSADYAI
jgi:hypothetical protein